MRDTPLALGVLLALLAAGTLAHVLVTSVHRRRRDLAILKTLGLLRPQLLLVVGWEAVALTTAALLAGLPLGLLAGHWSWVLFASSLGVSDVTVIPVPLVLLVIPGTVPGHRRRGDSGPVRRPGGTRCRPAGRVTGAADQPRSVR